MYSEESKSYSKMIRVAILISVLIVLFEIVINPLVFRTDNGFAAVYFETEPIMDDSIGLLLVQLIIDNEYDTMVEYQIFIHIIDENGDAFICRIYSFIQRPYNSVRHQIDIPLSLLKSNSKVMVEIIPSNTIDRLYLTYTVPDYVHE